MISRNGLTFIIFLLFINITTTIGNNSSRYTYVLSYDLENRGNEPYLLDETEATFYLFQNTSWQIVRIKNTTHPIASRQIDADGNKLIILDLPPKLDPNSRLFFSITYNIESIDKPKPKIEPKVAGSLKDIPFELVKEFCVETKTFNIKDESILALSLRLTKNETTVLGVVIQLLDWIIHNISYRAFEVPLYPNETLLGREGDCDDQAILFVTMCRAVGIPAMLQTGCLFNDDIEKGMSSWSGHLNTKQRGIGWHGWALVYIPPWGWLPIDMTLITSKEAISRITDAPEYSKCIITSLNVSRLDYIGEIYTYRERLTSSELYVRKLEISIKENSGYEILKILKEVKEIVSFIVVFILTFFPIFFIIFETIIFFYCLFVLVKFKFIYKLHI